METTDATTKKTVNTLPPPHPGYARALDSVRMNLRVAHAHGTALNAKELWARTDFSHLPVEKRQTFTAFSAWLRDKAKDGILLSRIEDDTERSIRLAGNKGKFARHATLYSLAAVTNTVPQIFKRYEEIEPLTAEQAEWLEKNPAKSQQYKKKVKAKKVAAAAPAPAPATPAADGGAAPEVMVLSAGTEAGMISRIAQLEEENARFRKALSHFGMALTALTE